jgi:hypothetical protein
LGDESMKAFLPVAVVAAALFVAFDAADVYG